MIASLEAIANYPLPAPTPCPEAKLMEALVTLESCLPSQGRDGISLEVRTEVYRQKLAHFPAEAIEFLQAKAIERCKWFPTIAECLEILREFPVRNPLAAKRDIILRRISQEQTTRFDEAMAVLATGEVSQEWIDDLPETWKRIAETRMLLWLHPDGSYTVRRRSCA